MTATVGGLWDSLLAEGKPWWISANSDSHVNWNETSRRPDGSSQEQFDRDGRYMDPVYGNTVNSHRERLLAGLLQPHPRRRRPP